MSGTLPTKPPRRGTEARTWWDAGQHHEAQARDHQVSASGMEVRRFVEECSRTLPEYRNADLARLTYRAYVLDGATRWQRVRLAWWVLWGGG